MKLHRPVLLPPDGLQLFLLLAILCTPNPRLLARESEPLWINRHRAAAEYRAAALRDEHGQIPDQAMMNALQQRRAMPVNQHVWWGELRPPASAGEQIAGLSTNRWIWLGPGNIGGRVRSILVHPNSFEVMWVGSVCGGIWKTVDAGASWFPCDDFMGNLAICCLALDSTDPDVIYAGTGEGFNNFDALRGAGIFKTTDGGTNWLQMPSTATSSFYYVNRLAISPADHLTLLAATGSGIWRSFDGGTNWTQIRTGNTLWVGYDPSDASKCVAAGSGFAVYSTNGGTNWNTASGLAASGRVELTYAPSLPSRVYASQYVNEGELYVSDDGGASYALVNTGRNYLGGQGWYDNAVWVDPTDPQIVIVGGIDLWRSFNGGTNLTKISQWSSAPSSAHADHHVIVAHPDYNGSGNRTVLFGNDGGVYRANDVWTVAQLSGWQELNNNLGITEFYGGAANASSGTVIGGTQDNGTLRYTPATGTEGWSKMYGGDGGYCAADPANPSYFYGEYVYLQIHRSVNGGASASYITSGLGDAGIANGADPDDPDAEVSANFIAPFILDPNNANTLLAGGSNLWRSVNAKATTPTWANIKAGANGSFISAIAVAPGNSANIWVGHNNGDVYSTSNGTTANPTWTRRDIGSPNLPNRKCLRLTVDPGDSNLVYACFAGFATDNIWRTTDGGETWTSISASLPAAPVHSLVAAPFDSNFIYVATEVGVFGSENGGGSWSPANEGPASVAVDELVWMDDYLLAVTRGRGIFKILLSPAPLITATSFALSGEDCQPANGVVDPGERVTFDVTLLNSSPATTTNLMATLLAADGVVDPSAPQEYGAFNADSGGVTRSFSYTSIGSCGGSNVVTLQLTDGASDLGTISQTVTLGTPVLVFAEGFDFPTAPDLPTNWTTSVSGGGAAWITTTTTADSQPNSGFNPESAVAGVGELVSPPIPIASPEAQLSFRQLYNIEADPVDPTKAYDGGVLEIKIAGGAFTDIVTAGGSFVSGGYTHTIDPTDDNGLGSRPCWSGAVSDFITTIVTLPAAAVGEEVQFKWRLGTDTANGLGGAGWYLDSIAIGEGYACCTMPPVIQSIQWTNNTVSVSWSAVSGQTYRIQSNPDLASTNWLDIAGDVTASSTNAAKTNIAAPDAESYYRVRTVP